jgi:hypothetical protein
MSHSLDQSGLAYSRNAHNIYYSLVLNATNDLVHFLSATKEIFNLGGLYLEQGNRGNVSERTISKRSKNCALMFPLGDPKECYVLKVCLAIWIYIIIHISVL